MYGKMIYGIIIDATCILMIYLVNDVSDIKHIFSIKDKPIPVIA